MQDVVSLFLDTCSQFACLILLVGHEQLEQVKVKVDFNHSDQTPKLVDDLLKRHNLTWMQVQKLYLTTGPGYYSGLRVGVAIAKTWFLINSSLAIYALTSLQFLAGSSGYKMSCVWVTKKILFYQLFINGQPITQPIQVNDHDLPGLLVKHDQFMRVDYALLHNLLANFQSLRTNFFHQVLTPDQLEPNYLRNWNSS